MNNECIWIEILCRLPVKSVFRFKCVSQHWLSLLSDPFFVRQYQSLHPNDNKLWTFLNLHIRGEGLGFENSIATTSHYNSPIFSVVAFDFSEWKWKQNSALIIEGSSNGLLLLLCEEAFNGRHRRDIHYAIFNPVTKQYAVLPPFRVYLKDPQTRRFVVVGFLTELNPGGVASYKVVRVPMYACCETTAHYFQVFSSEKEGKWEEIMVHFPYPIKLCLGYHTPVVYNQILHFIHESDDDHNLVIAYDPYKSSDRCRVFTMPSAKATKMCFGLFEGCLGFVCMDYDPRRWKIWKLNDYNKGEWSLAHDIFFDSSVLLLPKAFHPLDSNIIYFRSQNEDRFPIFSYNIQTRSFEAVVVKGPHSRIDFTFVIPSWPTVVPQLYW